MLELSLFHVITGSLHIKVCNLDIGRSTEGMWTPDNSDFNTTKLWNVDRHDTLMALEGLTWSFSVSADEDFGLLDACKALGLWTATWCWIWPLPQKPPAWVCVQALACVSGWPTGDATSGLWLNWGLALRGSVGLLPCSLPTAGTQWWLGWPPPCEAPSHVSGVLSGVLSHSHLREGAGRDCWWASLVAQTVKNLPAMWKTWFRSLGLRRPPWRRHNNSLQYSCLENPHG